MVYARVPEINDELNLLHMPEKLITYLIIVFLTSSCINDLDRIDNQVAPGSCLTGQFVDAETKEIVPLPVEGETGVKLRLFEAEESDSRSIDFYARTDGQFKHSRLFDGQYNLVVEQAPFSPIDTVSVNVKNRAEVQIEVLPFTRISANTSSLGNKITLNYSVELTSQDLEISEIRIFLHVSPYVDRVSVNHLVAISGEFPDEEDYWKNDAGTQSLVKSFDRVIYVDQFREIMEKNDIIIGNYNHIYLRVGVMCEGEYNYSRVIPVKISL
jgi:hypothetical protein